MQANGDYTGAYKFDSDQTAAIRSTKVNYRKERSRIKIKIVKPQSNLTSGKVKRLKKRWCWRNCRVATPNQQIIQYLVRIIIRICNCLLRQWEHEVLLSWKTMCYSCSAFFYLLFIFGMTKMNREICWFIRSSEGALHHWTECKHEVCKIRIFKIKYVVKRAEKLLKFFDSYSASHRTQFLRTSGL